MSFATDSIHMHCTAQATTQTPLGPLLLVRTARGLAGAWFEGQQHHPGALAAPHQPDDALLHDAAQQLQAYFDGARDTFALPLDLQGTAFQRSVSLSNERASR